MANWSQDPLVVSPPKIRRELVCPSAPQRPIALTTRIESNEDKSMYKASFPTTCVWRRLGLKQKLQEAEAEQRKKQKAT